jgi:S-DNA-T family DNA segregation ATPase FtsK/SpoIIIE
VQSYSQPTQQEDKPVQTEIPFVQKEENVPEEKPQSFTRDDLYRLNTSFDQQPPINSTRREEESKTGEERTSRRGELFDNKEDDLSQIIRRSHEEEKSDQQNNSSSSLFSSLFSSSNERLSNENKIEPDASRLESRRGERSKADLFDDDDDVFSDDSFNSLGLRGGNDTPDSGERRRDNISPIPQEDVPIKEDKFDLPKNEDIIANTPILKEEKPAPEEKPKEEEKPKHVWKQYVRPTLDLLDDYPENNNVNTAEIEESKKIIVETLSNFRIASQIANVVVGPAITRYDVIIEDRTNIKNALKYKEAIAMALMKENVTAYLNYSKGAISIEVPNSTRTVVGLKGMLASSKFINSKPNTLTFALGKNVEGQVVCPDITKMPHLLVAGTTGSGKSICLSALIVSLLYKYGPEELRFILCDPKQVEFISYDKLPHLMINEIIYDVDKTIKALNWAIKEMERRYQLFKEMTEHGVATKNLTEYNAHLPEGEEKLPKIVIILDEFGDLMLQAKKEIESRIIRLVQKARACGIHLILATQRPSVDCITGLIKSNLPTRLGFKVNSYF